MTATATRPQPVALAPEDERYAVVEAHVDGRGIRPGRPHHVIATCSEDALGLTLRTLHDEGQLNGIAVGVLDQWGTGNGRWLVDPWVKR